MFQTTTQIAQEDLNGYISSSGKEVTASQASLIQSFEDDKAEVKATKGRWGSAFITFWIISYIGFIGCTVIVVVYEDETGEDVTHNPTVLSVAWRSFVRVKDNVLAFIIRQAGLGNEFQMPALAGKARLTDTPTPPKKKQKYTVGGWSETQNRNTESQKTTQKTEQEKSENRRSVCDRSGRETQKSAENNSTEVVLTAQNREGEEWPTPDNRAEWNKLVKRAREWAKQSIAEASDERAERTRQRNETRWNTFVAYASQFGYRAGLSAGSGKAYVNQDPEPIWAEDGQSVYFGSAQDADFDVPAIN